jgi:hypothetical protein
MQPEQYTAADPNNTDDMVESNEHVLVVVHKHWAGVAVMYLLTTLVLLALVIIGIYVLPDMNLSSDTSGLITLGSIATLVIFAAIVATIVSIYYQSKLTLTDKSLVQIIQRSLFNRKISRLSMSNVEDVNVEQKGVIASIFNYGTLTVQTAGEEDNFVFSFCPNPNIYAERILEARQVYAEHHRSEM